MPATTPSRLCPASRLVEVAPPLRPDLAVLRRLRSARYSGESLGRRARAAGRQRDPVYGRRRMPVLAVPGVVTRSGLTVGGARYAPTRDRGSREPGLLPRSAAPQRARHRRWPARGRAAPRGVPVRLDLPGADPPPGRL